MKKLSLVEKLVWVINVLAVFLLLLACAVPYISSSSFAFLSFLSLSVPILVFTNFIFLLYWVFRGKKQFLPSLLILIFGYFILGAFLKFNGGEDEILEEDLSVMSFNVHVFNKYNTIKNPRVFDDVKALVDTEKPDIICFQEAGYERKNEYLKDYPYHSLEYIHMQGKILLGFFSKYPIIKTDFIWFPNSANNAAYADIVYKKDTIRVYNVHLESLGVTPGYGVLTKEPLDSLYLKLTDRFKKQQEQAKMLEAHMKATTYKQIVCGDFNNTQFSNVYKTIKGDKQDTFIERGFGYGRTLNFHKLPVRIDFILADKAFEVKSHKNFDVEYSDHFPIMASFELKEE